MKKLPNVRINPQILHSIIRHCGKTQVALSQAIGYSNGYLSMCMNAGTISQQAIDLALYKCGVDFRPALVKEEEVVEEQTATVPAKVDPSYLLKIIEDYSYTRSNDIDRLIRSIDKLTETIKEML